jgi:hypothetical protein
MSHYKQRAEAKMSAHCDLDIEFVRRHIGESILDFDAVANSAPFENEVEVML